jgi:hypothetical protein
MENAILEWVACGGYFKEFKYGPLQLMKSLWGIIPKFIVGSQYFTLIEVELNDCNAEPSTTFLGCMMRVRVDILSHGCGRRN